MTMTMILPRTRPQQATSVRGLQSTPQQTGINVSSTLGLLMPMMVVGLMTKMMGKPTKPGASGKPESKVKIAQAIHRR